MLPLVAIASVATTWSSWAAHEGVYQVAQPVFTIDGNVAITFVSYVGYEDHWNPGLQLAYTCAPNSLSIIGRTTEGFRVHDERSSENRNLANVLGLEITLLWNDDAESRYPLYGDTVKVRLTLPDEFPDHEASFLSGDVVPATYECMLLNAAAHWPRVKFLSIELAGPRDYAEIEGVHSLEGVSRLNPKYR